jgi:hypothetical protein
MAEIKSTLDLVMERTRNLTMTEEEKREQALSEFRKSSSGLIQKYLDGLLSMEGFRKELQNLQQTVEDRNNGALCEEIARRLDPDQDNRQLIALLSEVCAVNNGRIESVLNEYAGTLSSVTRERVDHVRTLLRDSCKVAGPALVPNLDADSDWIKEKQALRQEYLEKLNREIVAARL